MWVLGWLWVECVETADGWEVPLASRHVAPGGLEDADGVVVEDENDHKGRKSETKGRIKKKIKQQRQQQQQQKCARRNDEGKGGKIVIYYI